jgi:DNA-binding transcriptional MerR regulator
MAEQIKTSKEVEYDTENARRIFELLEKSERGMTIAEIAKALNLNRHTVTKLCEKMLLEKKIDYDEKGPAKVFYSVGPSKFVAKLQISPIEYLWIDVFKQPRYRGEEPFIRINQTKHDNLIRTESKFRSIGAVAIRKSQLEEVIKILRKVAKEEFGLNV